MNDRRYLMVCRMCKNYFQAWLFQVPNTPMTRCPQCKTLSVYWTLEERLERKRRRRAA